jgi:hypothetical protein
MRTKLRSRITLLFIVCALLIAIPAVAAIADNVQNDVIAGGNYTITTASSTTINYRITANSGDGEAGCNATPASPATLNINAPSGVTATPASRTFTSCGTNQSVQFSANAAGDYVINVSVSDTGAGTYNTNPARFTLHVTNPPPPPNTPPTLTLPGPQTVQATGPNGAVVTYNATANDAQDGPLTPTCTKGDPPVAVSSGDTFPLGITQVNCSVTDSGGASATGFFDVTVVDTTAPSIAPHDNVTAEATSADGAVVNYTNPTASDLVDGDVNVDCTPASGSQFPIATTTVNCSATDAAGNESTGSFTVTVQDTLAPTDIQFVGNINDGDSFFFGEVPAKPTCTATDGGSGLDSCVVSGYSTAVGTHTLKATAKDKVGNTSTKEIIYTVKPYTLKGFYQPVDMGDVLNTVKNGSTVPVKFELFKGTTELTSTSAVFSILAKTVSCAAFTGDPEDAIETVATGGTSLRYDATGGQFIYNWQTPKKPNTCYNLTMTATDGSTITAYFKLK